MNVLRIAWIAILKTPQRISDVVRDPIRRRNAISRTVEAWIGGSVAAAMAGAGWMSPVAGLFAIPAEFVYYEYIAEPLGWTGHYWERGPRRQENFERW